MRLCEGFQGVGAKKREIQIPPMNGKGERIPPMKSCRFKEPTPTHANTEREK
ncbi:Hypothetical predicted protein [Podarcis lilfordi]|uniref:Uncharacterized protein n=1 Tax=Podarcis lilfordi TaxID=74358 RepID=A0AA35KWC2_9SAUR|nr:Hypothetical predicted protein [Podarcis lilfordi]